MLKTLDFYFFSPTGGTKKAGKVLAEALAELHLAHDLADKKAQVPDPKADLSLIALPVYGGRIPAFVAKKLRLIKAGGKKVVTLAVYGNRAYEDALLELNNIAKESGFCVVASGAFIAQHAMCPEVGADRPDDSDIEVLKNFAKQILEKLREGQLGEVKVPGNYPYKADFVVAATPISTPSCKLCGKCVSVCPTDAISVSENKLVTDISKCALCMACVKACPSGARILPPPMSEKIRQMLSKFRDIRRECETFI